MPYRSLYSLLSTLRYKFPTRFGYRGFTVASACPTPPLRRRHPSQCLHPVSRLTPARYRRHPPRHLCPPPRHVMPHRPPRPGQVVKREGRRWPDLGQAQAQLDAARPCHHPLPPAGRTRPPALLCVTWKKKGKKHMLQTYVLGFFKCFRGMLQVFRISVAKVDRNVAYAAIAIHVCFKCVCSKYFIYIRRMLQVFSSGCSKSRSRCCIYTCIL
jgi:hypothetical protein